VLDRRPIAHLRFSQTAPNTDPLYPAILKRRTNRNPFKAKPIETAVAQQIMRASRLEGVQSAFAIDPARVATLRALAFQGAVIEAHTPAAHKESNDRTFFGDADVAAHPYGVSVRGPIMDVAHAIGLLTHETVEREGSFAYNQLIDFLKKDAETAQGFIWLTTAGNSRVDQLAAGAAYLRANLQATALGVSMQPFSQVLQEYPTMKPAYDAAHRELAPQGGRLQMFSRIGYADDTPAAPKRGVDAQIYKG